MDARRQIQHVFCRAQRVVALRELSRRLPLLSERANGNPKPQTPNPQPETLNPMSTTLSRRALTQ